MSELYEISGTLSNALEIPDKSKGLILVAVVFLVFDAVLRNVPDLLKIVKGSDTKSLHSTRRKVIKIQRDLLIHFEAFKEPSFRDRLDETETDKIGLGHE